MTFDPALDDISTDHGYEKMLRTRALLVNQVHLYESERAMTIDVVLDLERLLQRYEERTGRPPGQRPAIADEVYALAVPGVLWGDLLRWHTARGLQVGIIPDTDHRVEGPVYFTAPLI